MGNEVKEQGFTDGVVCPTGLFGYPAARFVFIQLLLFLCLVIPARLPAAGALKGGGGGGGRDGPTMVGEGGGGGGGSGGGGGPLLGLGVDGVAVVGEGGKGGGGHGLLVGLCLCCPRGWDGEHHVWVVGGGGGEGGGWAGGGGEGVGCGSVGWLSDDFWRREGEEARNG